MQSKMKLYQDEQNTIEYFNKLCGKSIIDRGGLSPKLMCVEATQRRNPGSKFPDTIRYKTQFGKYDIPLIIVMRLIEEGEFLDAFGYNYKIVEDLPTKTTVHE